MRSWEPSTDLQSLKKSKTPNCLLRKPEKSRNERQSSNRSPPKNSKSANQNKLYKKDSNSNINSAARPKTFQKTTERPL
jgi:hypothetical protein